MTAEYGAYCFRDAGCSSTGQYVSSLLTFGQSTAQSKHGAKTGARQPHVSTECVAALAKNVESGEIDDRVGVTAEDFVATTSKRPPSLRPSVIEPTKELRRASVGQRPQSAAVVAVHQCLSNCEE